MANGFGRLREIERASNQPELVWTGARPGMEDISPAVSAAGLGALGQVLEGIEQAPRAVGSPYTLGQMTESLPPPGAIAGSFGPAGVPLAMGAAGLKGAGRALPALSRLLQAFRKARPWKHGAVTILPEARGGFKVIAPAKTSSQELDAAIGAFKEAPPAAQIKGAQAPKMLTAGPYAKVSDRLMGFGKAAKDFAETKYPYEQAVRVQLPGIEPFEDVIKGMNQSHAIERALRNWPGAGIEVVPAASMRAVPPPAGRASVSPPALQRGINWTENRAIGPELERTFDELLSSAWGEAWKAAPERLKATIQTAVERGERPRLEVAHPSKMMLRTARGELVPSAAAPPVARIASFNPTSDWPSIVSHEGIAHLAQYLAWKAKGKPKGGPWKDPRGLSLTEERVAQYAPGPVSGEALAHYLSPIEQKYVQTPMNMESVVAALEDIAQEFSQKVAPQPFEARARSGAAQRAAMKRTVRGME